MLVMKKVGVASVCLAVVVGTIGSYRPSLFFRLPFPLSIKLWTWTGHSMPPYFSHDAWEDEEIDTWMKDGDLVVATGAKSGTNFMLYCAHQIRTRGTDIHDELFPDVSITTPWPELIQSRSGTWAEQKERYNTTLFHGKLLNYFWDNPSYPFRIFKSHYGPPELPVRKRGGKQIKYLAMVRNGLDVLASMSDFYSFFTDTYRNLWGGFPPDISGHSSDGHTHPILHELLPSGFRRNLYFGYVNKWWPCRSDPNVLMLHYTNVRKDLKGTVAKVAHFMGVNLTESELTIVTNRCSIEHMKKIDRFKYFMPLNRDQGFWDPMKDTILKANGMVRTGEVGKGKRIFSEAIVNTWLKAEEEQFGYDQALLQWAREGGDFPPVSISDNI